jgi:hypothetical protein
MMKGKWAAGIPPRHLTWVLPEILAASERPGGQTATHRKVRRQEEVIWLKENGFDVVISIMGSTQNLSAYAEIGLTASHHPVPPSGDPLPALQSLYSEMSTRQRAGQRVLLHQDELGDFLIGVVAGYLIWTGRLSGAPMATTVAEQLFGRQLGPQGRALAAAAADMARPGA